MVEKEINGGNPAIAGDDEISPGGWLREGGVPPNPAISNTLLRMFANVGFLWVQL
jgi:hypothetical protein